MPTTVNLPTDLLRRVDRRASELGVSRALPKHTGWSPAFRRMLERAAADAELQQGVDQMMLAIASRGASNWLGR